ncbi:hypothetical protein V6N12_003462 [Hibiscus sabdariffa]|uniref:Uncharacterized protein n=1 Tax=Hibiscus sabdariffa TaxID=183260 RepID=A0ABR2AGB6_9ROSI
MMLEGSIALGDDFVGGGQTDEAIDKEIIFLDLLNLPKLKEITQIELANGETPTSKGSVVSVRVLLLYVTVSES